MSFLSAQSWPQASQDLGKTSNLASSSGPSSELSAPAAVSNA